MKPLLRWHRVAAISLLLIHCAFGHDVGLSTATVQSQNNGIGVSLTFAAKDIDPLLKLDTDSDGRITQNEFRSRRENIGRAITNGCLIQSGQKNVGATAVDCLLDQTNNVVIHLLFPRPESGDFDICFPVIAKLAMGHRMFVTQLGPDNKSISEQLLSRETSSFHVTAITNKEPSANTTPQSFTGFLWLGIEHIGTGYDHLLFLFGLLLVARSLKSSLVVISSFTLAHSITLAASTLHLVTLRPSITEPAIAASIIYVGLENLLRRGEPSRRWLLTFAFGLIHGFGFASVLRDMGVGVGNSVVMPLFSFNLGVELGQMTIAAIMLPIIWKLRTSETFTRRLIPTCCIAIAGAGSWWFCARVWGI